jgi:hypothetical protein
MRLALAGTPALYHLIATIHGQYGARGDSD